MIPRVIQLHDPQQPQYTLAWRKEWVSDFESPWSIFEKFKYANCAKTEHILSLFGGPRVQRLKNKTICAQTLRNLKTLAGFDDNLLQPVFGRLRDYNDDNINQLVSLLPRERDSYLYDHLRFCPTCLSKGYHSIFHQFKFINYCPFHQVKLLDGCPKCKLEIPYYLSDRYTANPFQCVCGHFMLPLKDKRYPLAWEKISLKHCRDITLKHWVQLNHESMAKQNHLSILFNPDNYITPSPKALKFIVDALDPSYNPDYEENHCMVYSSKHIRKRHSIRSKDKETARDREKRERKYLKLLEQSTKQTLSSIVSAVKKRLINDHRYCLRQFQDGFNFQFMSDAHKNCAHASAYLRWRQFIAQHGTLYQVDKGKPKPTKSDFINERFANKQDELYLRMLAHSIEQNDEISTPEAALWIINHVNGYLILNHFKNWLIITSNFGLITEELNASLSETPQTLQDVPFYLIVIPKDQTEPLQFHWWLDKDFISIEDPRIKGLHCSFSTSEDRRNFEQFKYRKIKDIASFEFKS